MDPSILKIQSGTIIDQRFEILGAIGRGGFATVYKARQLDHDRLVALKILGIRPGREEAEVARFTERFLQEARWAASIEHPNVVTILDHGITGGGIPFIAMELLEGRTLGDEISAHGPMAPSRALPLFLRCLDGLASAHALGIVHKDLKPSNLFLHKAGEEDEDLKILDFGIAALADAEGDERLTGTDQFIGTAAYTAPEYYKHKTVSPALDIYQIGLVLAEALMGERVVDTPDVVQAISHHCRGALHIPFALTTGPLGEVLKRALALDPKDRYASAAGLQSALEALTPQRIPTLSDDDLHTRVPLFPELANESIVSLDLVGASAVLQKFGELRTDTLVSPPTTVAAHTPTHTPVPEPAPPVTKRPTRGPWVLLALLILGASAFFAWKSSSTDSTPPPAPNSEDPKPVPLPDKAAPKPVAEIPDEPTPDPTPDPIPDRARPDTRVSLQLVPAAEQAAFEVIGAQKGLKKISGSLIELTSASEPMPWELRIVTPRRQDTLLRVEHSEGVPGALSVRQGQKDKAGHNLWGAPTDHSPSQPGHFAIKVELKRQSTPSSNQKRTFKKEWIID